MRKDFLLCVIVSAFALLFTSCTLGPGIYFLVALFAAFLFWVLVFPISLFALYFFTRDWKESAASGAIIAFFTGVFTGGVWAFSEYLSIYWVADYPSVREDLMIVRIVSVPMIALVVSMGTCLVRFPNKRKAVLSSLIITCGSAILVAILWAIDQYNRVWSRLG